LPPPNAKSERCHCGWWLHPFASSDLLARLRPSRERLLQNQDFPQVPSLRTHPWELGGLHCPRDPNDHRSRQCWLVQKLWLSFVKTCTLFVAANKSNIHRFPIVSLCFIYQTHFSHFTTVQTLLKYDNWFFYKEDQKWKSELTASEEETERQKKNPCFILEKQKFITSMT
jgi:hypothetical protein